MISAFSKRCSWSSFARSASAGGQLEHPSEVKSSTTTGRIGCIGSVASARTLEECRIPKSAVTPARKRAQTRQIMSFIIKLLDLPFDADDAIWRHVIMPLTFLTIVVALTGYTS